MLIYSALFLCAIWLIMAGWWLITRPAELQPEVAEPPDPIVTIVDKWAHDWERGRA